MGSGATQAVYVRMHNNGRESGGILCLQQCEMLEILEREAAATGARIRIRILDGERA